MVKQEIHVGYVHIVFMMKITNVGLISDISYIYGTMQQLSKIWQKPYDHTEKNRI
jgi:hypothetical protein